MRPDRVRYGVDNNKNIYWKYTVDGKEIRIKYDDIVHFKYVHPTDDWYGLSPLSQIFREAGIDSAATDYTRVFLNNSAVPAGFLMIDGVLSGGEEESKAIAKRWAETSGGMNRGSLMVIEGNASYQQASMLASPEIPDLRALTETRICLGFKVPPLLVQTRTALAMSSGRSEYQQARKSFWEETMSPLYVLIGEFLTRLARMDFGQEYTLKFDLDDVKALQENQDMLYRRVSSQWNDGLITKNEAREATGKKPVDDGDVTKDQLNQQLELEREERRALRAPAGGESESNSAKLLLSAGVENHAV